MFKIIISIFLMMLSNCVILLANPGEYRKSFLKMFRQIPNVAKMGFLTTWFITTEEDITDAEFVSIDIERSEEDIAPVLRSISTGAVVVAEDVYTNKTIRPPAYALEMPLNVYDLLKRQAGQTEYEQSSWMGVLANLVKKKWAKMMQMLKYSIELQASQILQTGTLTINDDAGNAAYILDYKPKATHFPTVSVNWSTVATAAPLDDIDTLSNVIRDDGLSDVVNLIMGDGAWGNFLRNAYVKEVYNNRRYNLGEINPKILNLGGKFQGTIDWKGYSYNIFTYSGRYKASFGASTKTRYIASDKVVFLPEMADLDFRKVFGGIPIVVPSMPPFNDFLPSRVPIPGSVDFKPRVYTDEKAEVIVTEIKSRPLLIPVSIDKYGCLDTEI